MPVFTSNSDLTPRGLLLDDWDQALNGYWQPCYTANIPEEAVGGALILQIEGALYSNLGCSCDVAEFYGSGAAEWDSELDQLTGVVVNADAAYISNTWHYDCVRIIVAYRGPGTLIAKITNHTGRPEYPARIYMVGYFPPTEFVAFDERYVVNLPNTGGAKVLTNVTGEPWYNADATCYIQGRATRHDCNIWTPGWHLNMSGSEFNARCDIFWPENGEVYYESHLDSQQVHIPGYFIAPARKGVYPSSKAPVSVPGLPFIEADNQDTFQLQGDTDFTFSVIRCEQRAVDNNGSHYSIGNDTFSPSGSEANPPTKIYQTGCGRRRYETYVLPSLDNDIAGDIEYKFYWYDTANQMTRIELITFLRYGSHNEDGILRYPDPVLGEPSIEQSVGATLAVPVVYRTASGSYTWNGTFVMYLSGGSSNADPALSLGGDASTTAMGSDIFGSITNRKAQLGGSEYRCVFLRNTSASETAHGLVVWVENQARLGNTISLGLDPAGVGGTPQVINTEYNDPVGVEFFEPSGESNALVIGSLPPLTSVPIWINRTGDVLNSYSGEDLVTLAFSVANNG